MNKRKHGSFRIAVAMLMLILLLSVSVINAVAAEGIDEGGDSASCEYGAHIDERTNSGEGLFLGYNSAKATFDVYGVDSMLSGFNPSVALYEVVVIEDEHSYFAIESPLEGKPYKLAYVDALGGSVSYFSGSIEANALVATDDLALASDVYVLKGASGYALGVDVDNNGARDGYLTLNSDSRGGYSFSYVDDVNTESVDNYAANDVLSASFFAYEDGRLTATVSKSLPDNICDVCEAELSWLNDGEAITLAIVVGVALILVVGFLVVFFALRRRSADALFRAFKHYQ